MKRLCSAISGLILLGTATQALAGGYDTPMLYSARHMGMGGAAAGYVDDPSALFHNPAGLGHIDKISLLGDFSLLLGGITASPSNNAIEEESELVVAPFFLVGGGVRILDWLTVGLAVYPVASASGEYLYEAAEEDVEDSTTLVFIEGTLGAAVNFDSIGLRLGAGYRLTSVSLTRKQIVGSNPVIEFNMSGWNFASFRVGAQWTAIQDHLSIGVSYRHKTVTEITADEVTTFLGPATDGSAEVTLPGRMIFGLRGDYASFGAAVDLEYAFNQQNERLRLKGTLGGGGEVALDNIFKWENAITLRVGGEYRWQVGDNTFIPRLGFVFDARTARKEYPSAFGTPPGPTYVLTAGFGFERGPYGASLAYGYRFGNATVTTEDLNSADEVCTFCSKEGDYSIYLNGIYVDFSYDFE